MLVVHVAPTLEALAAAWTEHMIAREAASPAGSFAPTTVVVPDPGVAHVLDFALARRRGVAANVRMQVSLGRTERRALLGPLVGLLERLAAAPPEPASPLDPLRRWLTLGDEPPALLGPHALEEARARRRAALALRLARRFEAYAEAPGAEPAASWSAGRAAPSAAGQAETEAWQRALWERLPARAGGELPQDALHVVAPTALSPSQVRDLARVPELHAWFVLPAPGRAAHPLAEAASAAVRDAVGRLLAAAPGALDLVPSPAPAPATLLGRLQAVLRGEAVTPGEPDGSLEALGCADARRAAEVVAQEVALALRRAEAEGRPLRLQEVAVVLAGDDPDGDRARLAMAFDAAHRLPIVFSDASPTRELRPVEAARKLLALPGSALVRSEVSELLVHPCVVTRLAGDEGPAALAASFEAWIEAAGVVRGLDAADQAGTYLEGEGAPLHTWDQGLLRLALAAYLDPASVDGAVRLGGVEVAPAPLGPGARVERLVALARSLLADARALRDLRLPLPAWAELLERWVSGLVSGTDEAERGALERALAALRGLAHLAEDDDAPEPVPYGVARALAEEALVKLRPRRDHDLTGGVVVGGLQALRGAPFRLVLLLGLAEGAFPAPEPHDPLDLRGPVPWDPGARARDQAALVERVLATTERLAIVWVARDPLTNEEVPWSPAVGALVRAAVDAGLVASPDAIVRRPPARREEEAGEALATPGGRREARAHALRLDLDRHLAAHGLAGAAVDEARAPVLEAALASAGAPQEPWPTADPPLPPGHVTLAALHDLLESPLQAWAKAGLRLWRDEEAGGSNAGDQEPFAPTRLDEVAWLREAFLTAVTGSRAGDPRFERALGAAWDRLADGARRTGRGPTGPFLAAARTRALRALGAWRDALDASPGLAHLRGVRGVRFGAVGGPPPGALPEEPRPPLVLDLPGPAQVALVGRTGPILADGSPLLLVDGRQATDAQLARAALELAALEAAGLVAPGDEPHRLRVVATKGPARTVRLRPFGRHAALDWLATLAADLRQPHPYALPLGPAARWLRRADGGELVAALRLGRESRHTPWDDDHGPLPRPRRAAPPPDAEALARRRLGPWLGRELEGRARGPARPEAGAE